MRSAVCSAALVALAACGDGPGLEPPHGPGHWILVDLVHTRLQNPVDHRLAPGVYTYQGVHGFARLFDHLEQNGYPWRAMQRGRLTDEVLRPFEVLFINLLSDDFPDFEPSEVDAILRFVDQGGGLVAISDHTNVYGHGDRLNRILIPMGIEVMRHSALDAGPASVNGSGWIAISRLSEHPINEGIETISFQTGGGFDTDFGVARLSDRGFADLWNPDTDGYYGNWRHDGDDAVEPRGDDVAVVAAAEYGAGRVAAVGDQNIYGDVWLPFVDNFDHALNVFEWAARADDEPVPLRDRPGDPTELAIDARLSSYAVGRPFDLSYYGLFHHLNREPTAIARAVRRFDGGRAEAVLLPPLVEPASVDDLAALRRMLDDGRRVVVLLEADRPNRLSLALVTALAPDFRFEVNGQTVDDWATWSGLSVPVVAPGWVSSPREVAEGCGPFDAGPVVSGRLGRVRAGDDGATELLDVRSDWGDPLFAAGGLDIARVAAVGAGELVVFVQSGFFTNRTLGKKETEPPPPAGEGAVDLIGALTRYLQTPVSCLR